MTEKIYQIEVKNGLNFTREWFEADTETDALAQCHAYIEDSPIRYATVQDYTLRVIGAYQR